MYRLSVPVMNHSITPDTRDEYLRQCTAIGADRIFLVPDNQYGSNDTGISHAFTQVELDALRENIAFFSAHGIEAAIWVGTTIGHGGLAHDSASVADGKITKLVNFLGEERNGTSCPLDPQFQANIFESFAALATTGARIILIDDDFRLSQHGKEFCCLCERHMQHIRDLCGEPITREELRARAFHGKPNRYRDAFLQAQGDSLRQLARVMRAAVDSVDPTIGIALCSCHCIWDADGTDPIELTDIFKGEHAPLLRLHGAPYWATHANTTLPSVFETARMFASFVKGTGIETMTECDVYPRPRYNTPASHMDLHDALMRADQSTDGVLKYLFDYVSSPTYETGYVERHLHDADALRGMEELFDGGTQVGVKIVVSPHRLRTADCDLLAAEAKSPVPAAGYCMAYASIPTTYSGKGICRAAFGDTVQTIADDELGGGLILDAVSAILLTERGIDVGLSTAAPLRERLQTLSPAFLSAPDGSETILLRKAEGRFLTADLRPEAQPLLMLTAGDRVLPFAYRYENAKGERFLVCLFDGASLASNSNLLRGYLWQAALTAGIEWLTDTPLPAVCTGHPDLYLLCAETEKGLTVGLWNCYADSILCPTVELNDSYTDIRFVNTCGKLDGNTVRLQELPAFGFAAFAVTRD